VLLLTTKVRKGWCGRVSCKEMLGVLGTVWGSYAEAIRKGRVLWCEGGREELCLQKIFEGKKVVSSPSCGRR